MQYNININGFIGDAGFMGGDYFTLTMLNDKLNDMPSETTEVNVYINSGGGLVTEGFAIYDRLSSLPVKVNTIVLGLCGSIATVIAQAGKKGSRQMYQNSDYFIHNPSWTPQSPDPLEADELQNLANDLKANEEKILNFYNTVTGTEIPLLKEKMQEAKTISSADALALGFIDKIIYTSIKAATIYKFAAHISKQTEPMNAFETKIKSMFADFKNEIASIIKPAVTNFSSVTDDGIAIYMDTDSLEVGTLVFSDEAMTMPYADGDIVVGGNIYTITGGVVTEIVETVTETAEKKLEIANAKIAELTASLDAKGIEITNAVEVAVTAKEVELTAKFEEKFTAFKGKFFTGDKLNDEMVQIMKSDSEPSEKKLSPIEQYALRNKK